MTLRIDEKSLRKLVRSLLEGETDVPVSVNPNVEPLVNDTQLNYMEKVPVDRAELANVITSKIMDLRDDSSAPDAYGELSDVIDDISKEDDKEEFMEKNEQNLRAVVRKMVREAFVEEAPKKRGYMSTDDQGGHSFDDIAGEFGFAGPAGAKAAVEKALRKMKFLMSLPEEDRDFLILSAMDDFITMMAKKGNFTPEDIELLRSNPTIVQELDGFREHLHKFVLRGMRAAAKNTSEEALTDDE